MKDLQIAEERNESLQLRMKNEVDQCMRNTQACREVIALKTATIMSLERSLREQESVFMAKETDTSNLLLKLKESESQIKSLIASRVVLLNENEMMKHENEVMQLHLSNFAQEINLHAGMWSDEESVGRGGITTSRVTKTSASSEAKKAKPSYSKELSSWQDEPVLNSPASWRSLEASMSSALPEGRATERAVSSSEGRTTDRADSAPEGRAVERARSMSGINSSNSSVSESSKGQSASENTGSQDDDSEEEVSLKLGTYEHFCCGCLILSFDMQLYSSYDRKNSGIVAFNLTTANCG